ncbi:MAG: hypothetical protein NT015_19185 [Alphaproteobacteria bacterium]|nr:hypothetical protein [Alphaproteobacteria bacterium]
MLVVFFLFLMLLVPIAVPRFWMVLFAGGLSVGLLFFFHWNALTADPSAAPSILDMLVPALRDGGIYTIVSAAIYGVKRLFVRAEPRKPSNID